ncbi:hypothetical protein vBBak6_111 [Bacillus phage v_B-Bak6]|uniref:TFIIB-type domain-containing protein n=2 Tax=Basiliskvirus TaxID=3044670 RepID=A0A385IKA9_9CAUD|nr:hypothetical protein PP653_gp045 [Bacillus phage Basilisk]YP_010657011.1 hypothetical protein PP654_gp038 [Bacillus phage v_B-Bak10]AXY83071.1 hypothetical protein vBBak1_111 [Bacillus phage v_B-Bak1]AXY83191.1 hypothetical protein vBBak6_111 [Bacillus phage v_B-Bak6]AGR46657.1 hypothetical protein BASILISK_122 [Bacillus phage Basilisk]AXY83302.1 hypothetical protein vBBBak10_104 [Bacillus phage v_B-Bak10]
MADVLIRNVDLENLKEWLKCKNCDSKEMELKKYMHTTSEYICKDCGSSIELSEVL